MYLVQLEPTSYSALYRYIVKATDNFTNGERLYILGSIRSSRWYFEQAPEDAVVSRKDLDILSKEFGDFKYVAIEKNEELKDPQNALTTFVTANRQNYSSVDMEGLTLYIMK
jgi:hypothetical protein